MKKTISKAQMKLYPPGQIHHHFRKESRNQGRQLSLKNINSNNARSISSLSRKNLKESLEWKNNSPEKKYFDMNTRKLDNPFKSIVNVFNEESQSNTEEAILTEMLHRFNAALNISNEYHEDKITKVLETIRKFVGTTLCKLIEGHRNRCKKMVERVAKLSQEYQQQIKEKQNKQKEIVAEIILNNEGQIGKKLKQITIRGIINSQIICELQASGVCFESWVKKTDIMKAYIRQLTYNHYHREKKDKLNIGHSDTSSLLTQQSKKEQQQFYKTCV